MDALREGKSIIVDAVAGSGKTTTIIHAANQLKVPIQVVTFNKHLRSETIKRIARLGLSHPPEAHTYHSLAGTYFANESSTTSFSDVIVHSYSKSLPLRRLPSPFPRIIIIDEVQDMTFELYMMISRYISLLLAHPSSSPSPLQLVVMGDANQCLFKFREADPRFLTMADLIFPDFTFHRMSLRQSFRLTVPMAAFVNNCLNTPRIYSCKEGAKITYINDSPYTNKYYFNYLRSLDPSEVFVLAYSLKPAKQMAGDRYSKKPIHKLEHALVEKGVPCYHPPNEDVELDDKCIEGKMVFSTIHQSKGRERDTVVLFDFTPSYYSYYCRDGDPRICDNIMYVALSRARKELIIVGDKKAGTMLYLDYTSPSLRQHVRWVGEDPRHPTEIEKTTKPSTYTATELSSFLPDSLLRHLDIKRHYYEPFCHPHSKKVAMPSTASSLRGRSREHVSDISSCAINAIYTGEMTHNPYILHDCYKDIGIKHPDMYDHQIEPSEENIPYFLKMACYIQADASGFIARTRQLDHFDWLKYEQIEECMANVATKVDLSDARSVEFERRLPDILLGYPGFALNPPPTTPRVCRIVGRADLLVETSSGMRILYEFKCTSSLSDEHCIQLLIYVYMCLQSGIHLDEAYLINQRDGTVLEVNLDMKEEIINVVHELIEHKLKNESDMTDGEFLRKCGRSPPPSPPVLPAPSPASPSRPEETDEEDRPEEDTPEEDTHDDEDAHDDEDPETEPEPDPESPRCPPPPSPFKRF